jgi:hypothetical protein
VVTKAFNALDENWVSVYSPKDAVGTAGNWNEQIARARALQERTTQFLQRRWLELFIRAGEAVGKARFERVCPLRPRDEAQPGCDRHGNAAKLFYSKIASQGLSTPSA